MRVTTGRGTYTAGQVVICPGAWAPDLLAGLGVPFRIERQVQFWFSPAGSVVPFRAERHPIYIWEVAGGRQFYGFPSFGDPAEGVKVAFFRRGQACTPGTIDRTVHPGEVEAMRGLIAPRMPGVAGTFLRAVTCMYTNTPDEHFVIARHPGHEQVVVACGFSGHGFKFVPVVGEIIADLVADGATAHPIGLFDPGRLAPT